MFIDFKRISQQCVFVVGRTFLMSIHVLKKEGCGVIYEGYYDMTISDILLGR